MVPLDHSVPYGDEGGLAGLAGTVRFSVVIPCLNSPMISQVVQALMNQSVGINAFEGVIVGRDELGLFKQSETIRFIATPRPVSPAVARNIGIRSTNAPIVVFLDADAIPAQDWLERIGNRFKDTAVGVVGGGVTCVCTNFWMVSDHISAFHEYLTTAKIGTRQQLPSINLAIRRSVLEEVGFFDERFPLASGEDTDLTTRIRQLGNTIYFDPAIVVTHVPARVTAKSVFDHAWQAGRYSIKVDARWRRYLRTPLPLRHRWLLLASSPLIALAVTLHIFAVDRSLLKSLSLVPVIWGLKLAWCIGAAEALRVQ